MNIATGDLTGVQALNESKDMHYCFNRKSSKEAPIIRGQDFAIQAREESRDMFYVMNHQRREPDHKRDYIVDPPTKAGFERVAAVTEPRGRFQPRSPRGRFEQQPHLRHYLEPNRPCSAPSEASSCGSSAGFGRHIADTEFYKGRPRFTPV